jgi:16S rRNA processing protein RimM
MSDASDARPKKDGADRAALMVVGKISGCHGIKGWVKIHPFTQSPESFMALGAWQLKRRGAFEPVDFDGFKAQGRGLVAHIRGVDDRTLAERYRGLEILAPESALPVLPEGEYYWRDLQGLQVRCQDGDEKVLLGTVDYLIETGANDVLVVKACAGSIDERERLIPYRPGVTVTRVDLEQAVIEVDWFVDD